MNLLKELPKNFRYYLMTSKLNNIYVLYNKYEFEIQEDEETSMENTYMGSTKLEYNDDYLENQTIKKSVNYNEVNIDKFYRDVFEYINARKGKNINTIKFVNFNVEDKGIVFTNDIFKVVSDCLDSKGEFIVDIKESALRVHNEEYQELKSMRWTSGTLLIEDTSPTLSFNTIYIEQCTISTHNKDSNAEFINIIVSRKANVINLKVLSTIKVNIYGNALTTDSYNNSVLLISSYNIFGNECLQEDAENPRLTISRFKRCTIEDLKVEDDVTYSSIVRCDKLLSFTIQHIFRNISDMAGGVPIIIGSVANVTLSRIELNITKKASIPPKSALITFNPDDSELKRKINVYETNIVNDTDESFYLFKLSNVKINKIYISGCTFENGINILDMSGDSLIEKFFIDATVIKSTSLINFSNVIKLALFKNTIETNDAINVACQRFTLENNNIKFKSMFIKNEDEPMIKFSSTENVINGENFIAQNPASEFCQNFYDTKSMFEIDNISYEGFNCSFDQTYLKCSKMVFGGDNTTKLIYPTVVFDDITNKCDITFKATVNGTIIFDDNDNLDKCELNVNIADEIKYLSTENISFNCTNKSPSVYFNTNMPIKGKFINFSKDSKIHMKVSDDYETKQNTLLTFMNSNPETHNDHPIVLNDSEQKINLFNIDNEYENKTFVFKKK